jgi:cytoplasmic iron level regulating protein YaaA (DUF328/UPF0246 family)
MIRDYIQSKLNELTGIESGVPIQDDIIEYGKTYFNYELSVNYIDSDFERNQTNRVNIIGYISRKANGTENTQEIIDTACKNIIDKLKELNFKCSYRDITQANSINKAQLTGFVEYNEINNGLI